jgi:hypothetical protein
MISTNMLAYDASAHLQQALLWLPQQLRWHQILQRWQHLQLLQVEDGHVPAVPHTAYYVSM